MKFKELVKEKAAILDKRPSRIIHETLREINSQQLTASLSKYDKLRKVINRVRLKKLDVKMIRANTLSYAFVHPTDVVSGFEIVKLQSPSRFASIISYYESNYVGRLKKGVRAKPRFAIKYWNVFNRVQDSLPRTTNAVEGWHRKLGAYGNKHLSVMKVLDMFRQEE